MLDDFNISGGVVGLSIMSGGGHSTDTVIVDRDGVRGLQTAGEKSNPEDLLQLTARLAEVCREDPGGTAAAIEHCVSKCPGLRAFLDILVGTAANVRKLFPKKGRS